jgi:GAF domain-containing protein/anti-sigma regulatory factor (Ser/Thr protein kinase)
MSTVDTADDLTRKVQELERELAEARQQQAGTSDILRVISGSTTDITQVFDAIARSAARLCEAFDVIVLRVDGDVLRLVAHYGPMPAGDVPLHRGTLGGCTVIERRLIHIEDLQIEIDEFPEGSAIARERGHRTTLSVPLLKNGEAIGNIQVRRNEVRLFSDQQIGLLMTFADQAVIAIENARLFEAGQASKRELQESLEYQTAISEVLNVISRSPSQVQPVLDAIAGTAARLCSAEYAFIGKAIDNKIHLAAASSMDSEHARWLQQHPVSIDRSSATGRTALERRAIHIPDILADPEFAHHDWQNVGRQRTILGVPLLHEGNLVGVIMLVRNMVRPFTQRQIELVTTFADQAVIAINNVRLFEEVQARNRALAEANTQLTETLEQQTATSRILRVISRSPTDVQPMFETTVESAARLCDADRANIYRFDGEYLRVVASYNQSPELREFLERNPIAPGPQSVSGRAALHRQTVHVPNLQADPEITYGGRDVEPIGTALSVPILKGNALLGVIFIYRLEVRPFTSKQIALVETFADQAAIAISNVGLFEEVQARNSELRVALEQQTATSELLKVIGRSTFDMQPVFQTLAENAVRLCEAEHAFIFRFDGQFLRSVATHNIPSALRAFVESNPIRPGHGSGAGRAALERRTIQIEDMRSDEEFTYGVTQVGPMRTVLAVPMLRPAEVLGVILITRPQVRLFTDNQIALMETFADQAVIAIENTRLFEEVQARNRDLTALGEVGRAVSSTLNLKIVLKTIVDRAVDLSGTDAGSIFYFRQELGRFELGETSGLETEVVTKYRKLDIAEGQTGLGEAIAKRQPLQLPDVVKRPSNALRDAALEAGLHAALIVPLLGGEGALGALVLQRRRTGEFSQSVVSLTQSFADQSAIALENARLFDEIAQKSRELEIASQHKSQFVANMSHELRTPLAAILGYAELIQEGFYGPLSDKALESLTRIRSNGKHLLGLINTVLDIAKIESGQFTLNMTEYAIESVVETVRSATESLAQNKKLALKTEVAKSLPIGLGDEQRLTQVLLNLVGNAIKFTDAGEVRVTAKAVNGHFNVSVTDTGPGIAEEHQARIFEQFHQVDSSNTKAKGGTGLGLAIAKQIVEMHGGRIWVESTLGKGSIFQMELPTRAELRKPAS